MKYLNMFIIFLATATIVKCHTSVPNKVCQGTNGRLSVPSNKDRHYRNLRERYTNCTHVEGNLEITHVEDSKYDLSFLEHIREVTGYMLIKKVNVETIRLPRLRIIRGRRLFHYNYYNTSAALLVLVSEIFTLEMPALVDIPNGNVDFINNQNLCHVKSINWDEIISGEGNRVSYVYEFESPSIHVCPSCDSSCEGGCWGEGAKNCQRFSRINCSPKCWQNRCFGPGSDNCCHSTCVGGCTGPNSTDCFACKHFNEDGVCVHECSGIQKYNPMSELWEINPNGTFAYYYQCVKKCPEYLVKENGACVEECSTGKMEQNGECVICNGSCPRICHAPDKEITSATIDSFKGCTTVHGFIMIDDSTFGGYQMVYINYTFGPRIKPMHPDKLEVFSTLKEITGFLYIQAEHKDFKNLSYFRNLEVIRGRQLAEHGSSLYIGGTSLESVELPSLKEISHGIVTILSNRKLCHNTREEHWKKVMKSTIYDPWIHDNKAESCSLQT